jgi:hypothetical protein
VARLEVGQRGTGPVLHRIGLYVQEEHMFASNPSKSAKI